MDSARDTVIDLSGITKTYKLYSKPSQRVAEAFHPLRKKLHKPFDALKDVSLSVERGQALGIMGRNGSGKSTLLQVVCGVLSPDAGACRVHGRVAALLELGAGFNPEFTGRQNVFLYGAILGMGAEEIKERFDSIAAFADIGQHLDQPVKTYSSGMYVRLCFATAIASRPDVLVVDEALAVGDEAFQRKCYARIREYIEAGTTLLFVTHSGQTVVELCDRAVLMDRGELIMDGAPKDVVARYHGLIFAPRDKAEDVRRDIIQGREPEKARELTPDIDQTEHSPEGWYDEAVDAGTQVVYEPCGASISRVEIRTPDGRRVNCLRRGLEYDFSYRVEFSEDADMVRFGNLFKSESGVVLSGVRSHEDGQGLDGVRAGSAIRVTLPFRCRLGPGFYQANAGVTRTSRGEMIFLHRIVDAVRFRVLDDDVPCRGPADMSGGREPSVKPADNEK